MTKQYLPLLSFAMLLAFFNLPPTACSKDARAVDAGSVQIEVGPFDIHRHYRSMEGPYVMQKFRIADLMASNKVQIPESMVKFIEGGDHGAPTMQAPSMQSNGSSNQCMSNETPTGLVDASDKERELLWCKGIKIEVLDENGKKLPTAEFICHTNIDIDRITHFMAFSDLEHTGQSRIFTLTQGQTEFFFPEGYAVPVASDEEWQFTFQAANRTSDEHRRVKHLCTLYLARDSELKSPMKALHWYNPYMAVALKSEADKVEHHGPGCIATSSGDNAPNMVPNTNFKDSQGNTLSPHWAIPPGRHKYEFPLTIEKDTLPDDDELIHAVWSHVHPACTNAALIACDGKKQEKVFQVKVQTKFNSGPELKHIDDVLSKKGIPIKAKKNYLLTAIYENPENQALDSMVALGIFCESKTFKKADWNQATMNSISDNKSQQTAEKPCTDVFCGIKAGKQAASSSH